MIVKYLRRWLLSDEELENQPCNKVGHDWKHKRITGYYTRGVPHFGFGDSWRVERQDMYVCTKCDTADFQTTDVGKVKVDKETDELTVIQ